MRTTFHDFKRADGSEVTVEYGFDGGTATTYSPHSGASGGDAAEVHIVTAFDDNGDVNLTDDEMEKVEAEILEEPPEFDDQDYD